MSEPVRASAIQQSYVDAAGTAVTLLSDPAVAAAWARPSALERMTVGGLAFHLGWQVLSIVDLVGLPTPDQAPIALVEHYARVPWLGEDLDNPSNTGIRDKAESNAGPGPVALVAEVTAAVDRLRPALAGADENQAVLLPWTGWALTLHDLLVTRLMEIVVHADDVAASVDIPTPTFHAPALAPVFALLTDLARRRHGDTAVLRALSRSERAPSTISAF